MNPSPSRSTVASSSQSSGRSLLSRLRAPLQSKTRNFADFYIQPDDPHRQYAPGDIISGSVIIKVIKPLRITHLVISLHGYAQVFKNPNSPGDAYKSYSTTVGSGKGKKAGSYFGNGFVSLFEDEAVLCGEGRLGEGVYHFNFELGFPSKGLPSSIEFERGTVSYMLTGTLTRPTTMSPTASCDAKVHLMDVVDIAPIPEPKPRIISLEPITRRGRAKTPRKRPPPTDQSQSTADGTESVRGGRVSELNSVVEESDNLGSPAPSDTSFESQMSSGNASGTEYGVRSVNTNLDNTLQVSSRSATQGKTITATIEIAKGGFLRGDNIPVKISVHHTKHVRSLKGIIVTLYRQARVDMHPALPVAPNSKGDKIKSEDYYPKSRTGLGGLSLSSAGSSHLFRKDLSQSFAPLFVDPRTLTAEVKCAVRVPDEAFPTISNVPGAMISFKYFVEVVVDIQGKLAGLDRMLPSAGLVPMQAAYGHSTGMGPGDEAMSGVFSTWGGNFADTDSIRREKGVVSSLFEVVIGTKDSERNGKRRAQPQTPVAEPASDVHEFPLEAGGPASAPGDVDYDYDYYSHDQTGQYYDQYGYDGAYDGTYDEAPGYHNSNSQALYMHPHHENEEGLSEKERLRRAEARLLPSQPPGEGSSSSAVNAQHIIPPSAPVIPEDDNMHPPYFPPVASGSGSSSQPPPPPFSAATSSTSHPPPRPFAQRRLTDDEGRTNATGSSTTINANPPPHPPPTSNDPNASKRLPALPGRSRPPTLEYFASSSSSAHVEPTDDKQELQRRRLELERSAPPPDDEAQDRATPSAQPSAPVLNDEDEGLVGAMRPGAGMGGGSTSGSRGMGGEALPGYER